MTDNAVLLGALAAGAVFKLGALSWLARRRQAEVVYVGEVSALYLYPVKSCRPVSVDRAECTETGLHHAGVTDRHWMVVDHNGSFVSQRKEPSMALIQTRIIGSEVELSAPGVTSIGISVGDRKTDGTMSECRVWSDRVKVMDCGDKAAAWISKYLSQEGYRIVSYIPGVTERSVGKQHSTWDTYARDTDQANFGDFCSYFLCSEASLDHLNSKLDRPVTMMTFRPNIVVAGCPAYAEDDWLEVRIGETTVFRYLDACPRCTLTTVDPFRGVKDPGQEPLTTLRSFRLRPEKYGKAPLFGTYLGLDKKGPIHVGDRVYALRWPHTP